MTEQVRPERLKPNILAQLFMKRINAFLEKARTTPSEQIPIIVEQDLPAIEMGIAALLVSKAEYLFFHAVATSTLLEIADYFKRFPGAYQLDYSFAAHELTEISEFVRGRGEAMVAEYVKLDLLTQEGGGAQTPQE